MKKGEKSMTLTYDISIKGTVNNLSEKWKHMSKTEIEDLIYKVAGVEPDSEDDITYSFEED